MNTLGTKEEPLDGIGAPLVVGDYVVHCGGHYAGGDSIHKITGFSGLGAKVTSKAHESSRDFYKSQGWRPPAKKNLQRYTLVKITDTLPEGSKF